jgi:hypothetical protein
MPLLPLREGTDAVRPCVADSRRQDDHRASEHVRDRTSERPNAVGGDPSKTPHLRAETPRPWADTPAQRERPNFLHIECRKHRAGAGNNLTIPPTPMRPRVLYLRGGGSRRDLLHPSRAPAGDSRRAVERPRTGTTSDPPRENISSRRMPARGLFRTALHGSGLQFRSHR